MILCDTGFRIAEFLELTRFGYDETNQTLTGGNKTDAGRNRVIPINPKIAQYVKTWANKNGQTFICKTNGTPYSIKYFREKCYAPVLVSIGVRSLTPHSCRHTFASLLHKSGADTVNIQHLMGHTDYALTANIYTHVDLDQLKTAISVL